MLHRAGDGRDLLLVCDGTANGGIRGLDAWRDHRAIGVVYNPEYERFGNHVPTLVPPRYDAFIHPDDTRALDAPHRVPHETPAEAMDPFPTGL